MGILQIWFESHGHTANFTVAVQRDELALRDVANWVALVAVGLMGNWGAARFDSVFVEKVGPHDDADKRLADAEVAPLRRRRDAPK